jgi:glycosyltransferase involved in cell wall biosynthesis
VTRPLRIALVSPLPSPPRDDVAQHVQEVARALARRGHAVTLLAPATTRDRIAEGRSRLRAAEAGDPAAVVAGAGELREVAVGRALPTGPGRRVGGPFDAVAALEAALSRPGFDVVDLQEPLAPSPALAALRHARGLAAVTFHRAEPLAGVAFLRPLVDRALARADLRIATTRAGAEALAGILPGDYAVVPPGVDPAPFGPPPRRPAQPPALTLVARGRDRAGVRFALGMLRGLDLDAVGAITLLGPPDAPWRTRAAVPKALRDRVAVLPDAGPASRAAALPAGGIAVLAAPEDASGAAMREALAAGCAVVAARCPAADELARHGVEALLLPPFSRDAWAATVAELAADPARRAELAAAAARLRRGWDDVAADLERAYAGALSSGRRAAATADERVPADLRVRPEPGTPPEAIVAASRARGLGAVAVASPEGIGPAMAVAAAAPGDLAVVIGQEIATADGALVGLFLSRDVEPGLDPEAAAAAVHAQGGVVMAPHPDGPAPPPSAHAMRRLGGEVDCRELMTGAAQGPAEDEAARLARRMGVLGCAGSGAGRPQEIGAAVTELRAFHGPSDFLDALADAHLARPPRRRRARAPQGRRRGRRLPDS